MNGEEGIMKCGVLSKECEYELKRVSFGSKECTKELKLECAYYRVWTMKSKVWTMKCDIWTVKCELRIVTFCCIPYIS